MTFRIMASERLFRIICCCLFIVNAQNSDIKTNNLSDNESESYENDIAAVFSHLNSTPFDVYIYKEATLLFAHKKSDITELSLDINVECKNIYPGVPCTPGALTCHAFIQQTSEGERQVLNNVNCKPKPEIFIEEIPLRKPTESGNAVNEPKMIDLSNEAVSSLIGEHFVAVKKNSSPCLGCPYDLNPNVEGVDELVQTVLRHVESEKNNKHVLIKIIRLQQQVVAGFKYFLTVEIAPTVCSKDSNKLLSDCPIDNEKGSNICEVTFWHQAWDSNVKHIIHNNCTISQKFDSLDNTLSNDIKNIKTNPAVASNFDNIGSRNAIDPKRLADLESQIETDGIQMENAAQVIKPEVSTYTETADSTLGTSTTAQKIELIPKENESSVIKTITDLNVEDDDLSENRREKRSKSKSSSSESNESSKKSKASSKSKSSESVESSERNSTSRDNIEPLELNGKAKLRTERAIPPLLKIPPEEKHFVSHLADFAANALDEMDDDNNKRIVLQNLGGKKMMDNDGVYYNLIMRMGVSECLEEEPFNEKCRQKLLENYTKICKVQIFVNDDILSPKLVKSRCQNIKRDKSNNSNRTNYERYKRQIKSEHKSKSFDEHIIQNIMKNALEFLNEGRDESKQFKFGKLKSKNWYISDNLTHFNLKVKLFKGTEKMICKAKIIINDDSSIRSYKIKCQDEIYQFNSGNGRKKRQIPGAPFETSLNDTAIFDDLLEDSLLYLDSKNENRNKLKIQKVTSATKQVVAGIIHRVEAKLITSACEKQATGKHRKNCAVLEGAEPIICKFKIYDVPWMPNSKETTIECESKKYFFRGTPANTNQSVPNTERIKRELLGDDSDYTYSIMFDKFVQKYKKNYNKTEFNYRLKVFKDNVKYIRMLNTFEQGTAWYGITHFADLTRKEFSKSHGLKRELRNENVSPFMEAKIPDIQLPDEFDWRSKGVVTEVKNQEQCGSCWAFSVTGNIEGQYAIKHQKLLEFSEQELVDCDTEDQGCNGGLMDTAYRVIEKLGGLETEKDYPYDAQDEKCHFNRSLVNVQLTGAVNISQNETNMAKWLVANGPISIAINANAMQFYMGGVSHPFKFLCNPKNLDHGVLVVGYGVHTYPLFKKTLPYWIVKNSWGTGWGEQGYYRVYRGDGTCGVNQTPSSAIVV